MTIHDLDPRIARYYATVPADQIERLHAFRAQYSYQSVTINSTPWRYIDTLAGDAVLVVLAGGTTVAEIGFQTIAHLARRFRVIAPDYPPVDSVRELFAGLMALLDRLGVDRFHMLGGSYGGMMAHPLIRCYPERIQNVVFTAAPSPDPASARRIRASLRWLQWMPTVALRALIGRSFKGLIGAGDESPASRLLLALTQEIVFHRVGRVDYLAAMRRVVDMNTSFAYTPDDLTDWPGKMLFLFGEEDPATPLAVREATKHLYPRAEFRTLEGGSHAIALTHQAEYLAAIENFLAA